MIKINISLKELNGISLDEALVLDKLLNELLSTLRNKIEKHKQDLSQKEKLCLNILKILPYFETLREEELLYFIRNTGLKNLTLNDLSYEIKSKKNMKKVDITQEEYEPFLMQGDIIKNVYIIKSGIVLLFVEQKKKRRRGFTNNSESQKNINVYLNIQKEYLLGELEAIDNVSDSKSLVTAKIVSGEPMIIIITQQLFREALKIAGFTEWVIKSFNEKMKHRHQTIVSLAYDGETRVSWAITQIAILNKSSRKNCTISFGNYNKQFVKDLTVLEDVWFQKCFKLLKVKGIIFRNRNNCYQIDCVKLRRHLCDRNYSFYDEFYTQVCDQCLEQSVNDCAKIKP